MIGSTKRQTTTHIWDEANYSYFTICGSSHVKRGKVGIVFDINKPICKECARVLKFYIDAKKELIRLKVVE